MCDFLSAIVLESGDVLCDPEHTDSHEDLIESYGLKDNLINNFHTTFSRIEFLPPKEHIENLSKWELKVDGKNKPDWLNMGTLREKLEALVSAHIISDERKILLGGWWILTGNAKINIVKNANIKIMSDSSSIVEMYGASQVEKMLGASYIRSMHDSSCIGAMFDFSHVEAMHRSAHISNMANSSKVSAMCGLSQIETMFGSSCVEAAYDLGHVESMCGFNRIINDKRNK